MERSSSACIAASIGERFTGASGGGAALATCAPTSSKPAAKTKLEEREIVPLPTILFKGSSLGFRHVCGMFSVRQRSQGHKPSQSAAHNSWTQSARIPLHPSDTPNLVKNMSPWSVEFANASKRRRIKTRPCPEVKKPPVFRSRRLTAVTTVFARQAGRWLGLSAVAVGHHDWDNNCRNGCQHPDHDRSARADMVRVGGHQA